MTNDVQGVINTAMTLLDEARRYYESSVYHGSERCTNEALNILLPLSERDDLGDEQDARSAKGQILRKIAHAYNRLQTIADSRSDHTTGLKYAELSIAYCDRSGDVARKAGILANIGTVYLKFHDYNKALEYAKLSLQLHEDANLKEGIIASCVNVGEVYRTVSDLSTAMEYYQKALELSEELGLKKGIAVSLSNIGLVKLEQLDYSAALQQFLKALAISEESGSKSSIARDCCYIGLAFSKIQTDEYHTQKAEEFLQRAIHISSEIGGKEIELRAHKYLAELYKSAERWKECQHHFEIYHDLEKEVLSDQTRKQAALMEERQQSLIREKQLSIERAEASATQRILHKVLPSSIATRLINGEKVADYFPQISILFADIVGFTPIAARMPAKAVLEFLNYVFGKFDHIIKKHGCQKIKTMGDGYMAVAGAPAECSDHAERLARASLEMMSDIVLPDDIRKHLPKDALFHLRIGLHTGSAFAGIVGEEGFVYDVYSDAVNLASRMESGGEPGQIHCSSDFALHLQNRDGSFVFEERGEIDIKGKGLTRTYFLKQ